MNIMQGDAYAIPVSITTADNTAINDIMVDSLEIVIGHLRKTYPEDITYSDEQWMFPISQEESLRLINMPQPVQVRVKFNTGEVIGVNAGTIPITVSHSKEVL